MPVSSLTGQTCTIRVSEQRHKRIAPCVKSTGLQQSKWEAAENWPQPSCFMEIRGQENLGWSRLNSPSQANRQQLMKNNSWTWYQINNQPLVVDTSRSVQFGWKAALRNYRIPHTISSIFYQKRKTHNLKGSELLVQTAENQSDHIINVQIRTHCMFVVVLPKAKQVLIVYLFIRQTVVCENAGPFLMIPNFNYDSLRG